MDNFYTQLKEFCERNLFAKKIMIMPSFSSGYQLRKAATRHGINTINLEVETIDSLIKRKSADFLYRNELEYINNDISRVMTMQILQELKQEGKLSYFNTIELSPGFLKAVFMTINNLRLAGYSADDLKKSHFIAPARGEDLKLILTEFEKKLESKNYIDRSSLIKAILNKGLKEEDTYYLIPENLKPAHLEDKFLQEINNKSKGVQVLSTPPVHKQEAPAYYGKPFTLLKSTPESESPFSYLYSIDDLPEGIALEENIKLLRAYGENNEIKGVLRRIKENDYQLDKVVFFYTKREPYTQLLYDLSRELNLPVTFGEGISVKNTGPGQVFHALLDWVETDFSYAEIYRCLRDGIFKIISDDYSLEKVAYHLRQLGIGRSKERYIAVLNRVIEEKDNNRKLKQMRDELKKIFNLLPDIDEEGTVDTGELAAGVSQVLAKYTEVEEKLETEALDVICNRLNMFKNHYHSREDISAAVNRLNELISNARIGASNPEPGKLHIDSFRRGLWIDREITFLTGLSSEYFPGEKSENPILLEEEQKNYQQLLKQTTAEEMTYLMTQFLAARNGPVYCSFSSFDTVENAEINPSRYFLQIYRLTKKDPESDYSSLAEDINELEEFIPDKGENALQKSAFWLQQQIRNKGIADLEKLFSQYFPDIVKGDRAINDRYNGNFNQYLGKVDVNEENVDPRKNEKAVLSASRLESLAVCPFKYFLDYLLGLDFPEDMERQVFQWLDVMQRGSLLHSIYEKFYREIADKGENPSKEKHSDLILEIARNQAENLKKHLPPPSEMVYQKELQEIEDSCLIFLACEEDYGENQEPVYFELTFGPGENENRDEIKNEPAEFQLPSGDKIKLAGKIDRVDKIKPGTYNIIDYKTGSTYKYTDKGNFNKGKQLQHALYALAFEDLMQREVTVRKAGYIFPTLKGGGEKIWPVQEGRAQVLKIVDLLLDTIASGSFHPAVYDYNEKKCNFCDYNKLICEREQYDIITKLINKSEQKDIARWRELEQYD